MKGVAWDGVGAPQLESAKKAGELLSEVSMLAQCQNSICCIAEQYIYFNLYHIVT